MAVGTVWVRVLVLKHADRPSHGIMQDRLAVEHGGFDVDFPVLERDVAVPSVDMV